MPRGVSRRRSVDGSGKVASEAPAPVTSTTRFNGAEAATRSDEPQVHSIPLESIAASQRNPRRKLHGIDDLAASLASHGLLQPILVRKSGGAYELIAGHRRFAAA